MPSEGPENPRNLSATIAKACKGMHRHAKVAKVIALIAVSSTQRCMYTM